MTSILKRPLQLLVVDDDELDRMLIRRLLQQIPGLQFTIEEAVDVASGADAIRRGGYDCVVLDYRLPDGDGMSLLRDLRVAQVPLPPVVMQTVHDDHETAVQSVAEGAQDYLIKGKADSRTIYKTICFAMERHQLLAEKERALRELQDAMAQIKTLQGLLPICAFCKKIRDDRGSWQQMESYISKRTEAKFSHAFCPECVKEHYSEYLDPEDAD